MVSPREAEEKTGNFWGYSAENITAFSDIFKFLEKDSIKILVDPDSNVVFNSELKKLVQTKMVETDAPEIFMFFAGKGIRHLHDHDEQTKISLEKLKARFDFQFTPNDSCFGLKGLHLDEQISFFSHELFGNFGVKN